MLKNLRLGRKLLLALFLMAFGYIVLNSFFLPWSPFWLDIVGIGCAVFILALYKFAGAGERGQSDEARDRQP